MLPSSSSKKIQVQKKFKYKHELSGDVKNDKLGIIEYKRYPNIYRTETVDNYKVSLHVSLLFFFL